MTIYIKTDMTEMPEVCQKCDYYAEIKNYTKQTTQTFCDACFKDLSCHYENARPAWCPLREQQIKEEPEE